MIEIVESLPANTVQDMGRFGHRRYGLAASGAMDRVALGIGNALLGNAVGAAGIEVQLFPFKVRVLKDVALAVTGACCETTLDGRSLPDWWAFHARAGQELALSVPWSGVRAYLTVAGGIDVPQVLGSRSTHMRSSIGGLEGRPVRAGDRLPIGVAPAFAWRDASGVGAVPPEEALGPLRARDCGQDEVILRVMPAVEHDEFTEASCGAFWNHPWRVTDQGNRMGCRLSGAALRRSVQREMRSHAIVPGVIQVPPSGQPIIQLADANSAGGYPKIGVVIDADLWRVAQAAPRRLLRFVACSAAEAVQAGGEVEAYLARVRRLAGYCRIMGKDAAA